MDVFSVCAQPGCLSIPSAYIMSGGFLCFCIKEFHKRGRGMSRGRERERERGRPIDGPTGTCNEISVLEELGVGATVQSHSRLTGLSPNCIMQVSFVVRNYLKSEEFSG